MLLVNRHPQVVRSIANEPFKNNQVFVDTFFLVSGFLLSRLMLVELDKNKRINLFSFFALRYIRLTPPYAVVIAFYATLLPKIGSGPLWDARIGLERDRCVQSWWANIIYVNNYVNTDMLCMFQSWYIAADTQLFLISMFLVYTIWRWPTVGKILLFVVLALSLAIPFVITLISRLDPLLMMFKAELEDISSNAFFKNSYVKTHMRSTPYFLGVLLGYLIHRLQQSDKKVPKKLLKEEVSSLLLYTHRTVYSSPMASLVLTDSSQLTSDGFEKLPEQIMYPYAVPYDLQKHVFGSCHF
uniref:Acyltransferase 3 domain-containing protein n=1 Tax=Timema cristinae TaxID=61476 RepID=A0A7R9GZY3_TIMCR|nr:unnamed protein product [Timema cristinae]